MKRRNIIIVAALALGTAALAFSAPSIAQGWGMGPGMMGNYGQGYGPGNGPGPGNGQGYGPGWMHGGYGPGWMMRNGYGPGWMHGGYGPGGCWGNAGYGPGPRYGQGYGPGPRYGQGPQQQTDLKLTVDDVKTRMENWLQRMDNPRLKLGDVKEKDDNTITADVVTVDNSLVQRFDVNRHTGFTEPERSGG